MLRKFLGTMAVVAMLIGCGDDSSSTSSTSYTWASSLEDLGACDKKHEGETVYVGKEEVLMTCHNGFWGQFGENLIDIDSSVDVKSSSSQKNSDDDEYFDIHDETRSSSSKALLEIKLDVAADDTVLSLSHLNNCNSSHVGKYIYLISLSLYMICTEDGWKEYDPPKNPDKGTVVDPGKNTGKSDLTDYFDETDISNDRKIPSQTSYSRYGLTYTTQLFGECDTEKEGKFFYDSLGKINSDISPDHLFYCKNGVWSGVTKFFADTVELGKASYGTFKEGQYASREKENLSMYCHEDFVSTKKQVYVMDNSWRVATQTEICFKTLCSSKNDGEFYNFEGYQFQCHYKNWRVPTIFEMPMTDFSNKEYTYGTLGDERDAHVYRTTQIGSQVWMAENLNYKGFDGEIGVCYQDNPKNCEISGRYYTWNDYMDVIDSLPPATNQGICPDGWEVPTEEDFTQMLQYTNDKNTYSYGTWLFAKGAWDFSWDTYAFGDKVDMYGFSALGGMLYESGGYLSSKANFCTATISKGTPYYATMGSTRETISGMKVESAPSKTYCNLRCIKKTTVIDDNLDEDAE